MKTLVGLVLLTLLCSRADGQPADKPSRDWKRIEADGLEVIGNAPEKELRRALEEIAAFRSAIKGLLPSLDMTPREPTTLVVFRDSRSFQEFVPRDGRGRKESNVGGYFAASADRNYLVVPHLDDRQAMYGVVFHEYTHYLVNQNYRDVPTWLNEGMADF